MKRHLSYANVMATIAVFAALGGASYAAIKLPRNSVGTKQLKKNAVTGAKVKDGSLTAADFGANQLPRNGSTGLAGASAPAGAAGGDLSGTYPDPILAPDAVTTEKLASSAITTEKLANDAVTGAKVVDHSISTSDLVGTDVTGEIEREVAAHSCILVNFGIPPKAKEGQAALLTFTSTPPENLIVPPLQVVSESKIAVHFCNIGEIDLSFSGLGIRITTFG